MAASNPFVLLDHILLTPFLLLSISMFSDIKTLQFIFINIYVSIYSMLAIVQGAG